MLTTEQVCNRTKTVTRRLGWWSLKPGEILQAVEKAQGLKKGEKIRRLRMIRVVSTRAERLRIITPADVDREGFPHLSPADFVTMFCKHMGASPDQKVNRIEFEYIDSDE